MGIFDKKETEVELLFYKHFNKVEETIREFQLMIYDYLKGEKRFKDRSFQVHTLEHEADMVRHEVELKLFQGAFLPIYREDYLVLIEMIDKIANRCEDAADFLTLTHPTIPDFLQEDMIKITDATVATFTPVKEAFGLFMKDVQKVFGYSEKISTREQEVDKIEWHMITKIFNSELSLAEKILLKEMVQLLGKISNRMEDVGNQFEILAIKRRM